MFFNIFARACVVCVIHVLRLRCPALSSEWYSCSSLSLASWFYACHSLYVGVPFTAPHALRVYGSSACSAFFVDNI